MMPLRVFARRYAKDLAIRLGLLPYRHLDWSLPRWDSAYRVRDTDGYGELNELARYSLLCGYLRFIGRQPKVLDVGCGIGLLRQRIAPADFSEYVGVDHAQAAVDEALQHGYERSRFFVGDAGSVEAERFDVAICNEMLYFVPDHERLLEALEGLLVARGHLLVSMFGHPGDFVLWRHLEERFELVDRVRVRNERHPTGRWGWTVAWLRKR